MKIVLFDDDRTGLVRGDGVIDVTAAVQDVKGRNGQESMEGLIANFDSLRPALERQLNEGTEVPCSDARLRAPLPRPGKIMMMGANYLEGTAGPALPIWGFLKSPEAILDPEGTVILPPADASIFHHEAELVAVIGKRGKEIRQEEAMEYVFGYTCGVDVSGRFSSLSNSLLGKSYDTFSPIGPCLVTADEISDPHELEVRLSVDGQLRQDYNTSDMGHRIPECIEYMSSRMTINPGDLLFLGTNHQGLGALQDRESVEMEIPGIGKLRFKVSDPSARSWPKGIDPEIGPRVKSMVQSGAAVG